MKLQENIENLTERLFKEAVEEDKPFSNLLDLYRLTWIKQVL